MTRAAPAVAAFLACVATLTACGGDEQPAEPLSIAGDSTTPSSTPAAPEVEGPPATASSDEPVDGKLLLGDTVATSAEDRAVAEVWFDYWTELFRMYSDAEADPGTLYSLAKDAAATGPLDYLASMQEREQHQVGGAIVAVTDVRTRGDRAVVESCFRNSALNVDATDTAVETLTPFFTTREVLRREGPDWRVESSETTSRNERCDFR